jgi:hypothetical protein
MSGRVHQQIRLPQQFTHNEPSRWLGVLGERGDGDICAAVGDLARGAPAEFRHDQHPGAQLGMLCRQPTECGRQQVHRGAAEGGDTQRSRQRSRGRAARLGDEQVELAQDLTCVHEDAMSGLGRPRTGPAAFEQDGSDLPFADSHSVGHRGLGQSPVPGRSGETAGAFDGEQEA